LPATSLAFIACSMPSWELLVTSPSQRPEKNAWPVTSAKTGLEPENPPPWLREFSRLTHHITPMKHRRRCAGTEPESRRPVRRLQYPARDDKSYPYVFLPARNSFRGFAFTVGQRKTSRVATFGPYVPSAGAIVKASVCAEGLQAFASAKDSTTANRHQDLPPTSDQSLQGALCGPGDEQETRGRCGISIHVPSKGAATRWRSSYGKGNGALPPNKLDFERAAELRRPDGADGAGCRTNRDGYEAGNVDIRCCVRGRPAVPVCMLVMVPQGQGLWAAKNHFPRVPLLNRPWEVRAAFLATVLPGPGGGRETAWRDYRKTPSRGICTASQRAAGGRRAALI